MLLVWTAQPLVTILFCSTARLCDLGQLSDPLWAHETVNEVLNLGIAYGLEGLLASLDRMLEEEAGSQGAPAAHRCQRSHVSWSRWPCSKPTKRGWLTVCSFPSLTAPPSLFPGWNEGLP